ncbi:dihydrolipoamide acetyltransferase family protein [Tomitella gaofuii]|uniref:dihydrolipoamide acetyltransferase family protein n=1 Tax=Tomitella gaofuii TaxID=2760083 RepID=UPI0015FA01FA|nr:dihydrolipoamide acetyltransferase family protein [Tomitella gaofuii]
MSAPMDFLLPDLGEGLTEAELLSWSVAVGDTVELDQQVCEVETAKAVVELPAPIAGTVVALHAEPGATVVVGEPLVSIDTGTGTTAPPATEGHGAASPGEEDAPATESPGAAEAPAAVEPAPPTLVGSGPLPHRPGRTGWRRRSHATPATAFRTGREDGPRAKPSARKAARTLGVDLTAVRPARDDGVITEDDVAVHADGRDAGGRDAGGDEDVRRTPADAFRRATAEAVTASARSIPHASGFRTVDVTTAMDLLRRLRVTAGSTDTDPDTGTGGYAADFRGVRPTPLTLVAKAVLVALARHPLVNASWDEAGEAIVEHPHVNLGIAVAGPHGLTVPHIPAADSLGLAGLAASLDELVTEARAGRTPPARLRGGTFTITNIGVFGLEAGNAVINPGESAILSLGAVARRPWVCDDALAVRDVVTLGLSFDHRIIDGELAGRFLATVAGALENPLRLAG